MPRNSNRPISMELDRRPDGERYAEPVWGRPRRYSNVGNAYKKAQELALLELLPGDELKVFQVEHAMPVLTIKVGQAGEPKVHLSEELRKEVIKRQSQYVKRLGGKKS